MPKIHVVRLMSWNSFKTKKPKPEQIICTDFANQVRALTLEDRMLGIWTHVPNEIGWSPNKVAQMLYAAAKAMGMIVGTSDYLFIGPNGGLALEAKSKTGTQHPGQKDFQKWCEDQGIPYEVFRSSQEGLEILKKYNFIREK